MGRAGRPRVSRQGPVIIEWDEAEVERFLEDPDGPLGVELLTRLGEVVLEGARRRALRRTGQMADAMYFQAGRDEDGMFVGVYSPATSPRGFPYPIVHEGRRVRDRRAHRSLRPALRDIRQIATGEPELTPADIGFGGA